VEVSAQPGVELASDLASHSDEARRSFGRVAPSVWIFGVALVAFVAKVLIALNTFGSNDVAAFYIFARSLHEHGLEWTYRNGVPWGANLPVFNVPPLTAYYLELIETLSRNEFSRAHGLTFPFLLRFPGIVADCVVVWILLRISATSATLRLPTWALALFVLSPVSLMVSGFHGNLDPVMVMFLVAAAYMALRGRPVLCGIFFALSCQVKIVPLLFWPILFFFWLSRKAALRFVIPWLVLTMAMWSQPLLMFPALFAKNVLAFGSHWGWWGITYWLRLTQYSQFNVIAFVNLPPAAGIVATLLKGGIIASVLAIGWRRRYLNPAAMICSIAYAWLFFFALAPGFCAYYLLWLAPFVLLLSPPFYGCLTAASSLCLFIFYNTLAGGLPWHIAVGKFSDPARFNLIAPWSLWAWATIICGLIICWKKAVTAEHSLRLFSLKPLPAERA
jgi:uncharacterized membrane protein